MLSVLASLLAGLGLFFVGLHLLTDNLKLLSGRRLRANIAEWTKRPLLGLLRGGVFITITHIQHSLEAASDESYGLGSELEILRQTERGDRFARVAVDGIDAIL